MRKILFGIKNNGNLTRRILNKACTCLTSSQPANDTSTETKIEL